MEATTKKKTEVETLFKCPQIYYGTGSLDRVAGLKGDRVLLVTDKTIKQLGLLQEVENRLQQKGAQVKVFDEVESDPKDSTASKCAEVAAEFKPDLIIGLGGGSPMDVAKAAFFQYERPDVKLCDMSALETYGLKSKASLVEIPTTSGTGSEASVGCVITDSESGKKLSLACFELVPDIAILDPSLAFKMPPKLRATTGLDVLVHAVEAYISNMHNFFADTVAVKAIQTVFQYLEKSVKTGDEEAMERMHYSATLAGIAMTNSGLGIAHAIGHSIGALLHVPHGAAVGFVLPYAIEFCTETSKARYLEILKVLGVSNAAIDTATKKLSDMVRDLMVGIQIAPTLKGIGVSEEKFKKAIPKLTEFSENDVTSVTSPRNAATEDFKKIFEYMTKNRPIDF
jgi:alcohol dehydrogenase class IV